MRTREPVVPWERPRRRVTAVLGWFVTALFLLGVLGVITHCAAWQRAARDVLSVVQVACIIAHQTVPDADVQRACAIADELIPPMRNILSEARAASARAREEAIAEAAGRCK